MGIPLRTHDDADVQTLPEYQIGAANERCDFPGIAQCFAVVGAANAKLICAHISPGTTSGQMKDIFSILKASGGDTAAAWYVVGPCTDHFDSGPSTVWQTEKKILKTFRTAFGKRPSVSLLDTTNERNVMRPDANVGGALFKIHAIDIRAIKMGIGVNFSYREQISMKSWGQWQPLNIANFRSL